MQAAVKVANSPTLQIVDDFEIPKPGPKQVLIKIQASGVCHTDVSHNDSILLVHIFHCAPSSNIADTNDVSGLPSEHICGRP